MKTAEVTVTFRGDDWRNELTMRSPTGRQVTIRCNGKWNMMSDDLTALIKKHFMATADVLPWGKPHKETVTHAVMAEALRLSKLA